MRYVSTRGAAPILDFAQVTLAGLASDGGLYVPDAWPRWSHDDIAALAGLTYPQTAARVLAPFVADAIPPVELLALCEQAYGRFAHAAVTPLVQLDHDQWLLELFHGPTLAFKDVAMQLLGLLFERFLTGTGRHLTVIGATSGDTGSAAIDALAGREGVEVFMLHPAGRVTDVQRRQMTTVGAPNIHNIAVEGHFDDAQALVKAMFNDRAFASRYRLSAVNSINWARLAAQIVYYFHAAVRLGAPDRRVAFSVPTGNFGDVFAGYVAARMGLPVERLIVATNVNDILHRALGQADYSRGAVQATATPSMDIQVSSNFERLLFDLGDRDGPAVAAQMTGFEQTHRMRLTDRQHGQAAALFASDRVDADDMMTAMRWACERSGEVIDPHTGIALAAARRARLDVPIVTLATAHPAKFRDTVERATGVRPQLPGRVGDLFQRPERFATLPATFEAVTGFIADHATPDPAVELRTLIGEPWPDYGLVDSGDGRKLERYGPHRFIRPEPQALWSSTAPDWQADAEFIPGADEDGGGRWQFTRSVPRDGWPLRWDDVRFTAQTTPFRHLGFFPDMAPVWTWMREQLFPSRPEFPSRSREELGEGMSRTLGDKPSPDSSRKREEFPSPECLNLFGYTGVGSLALASRGARVTHVDASRKSVEAARANARLSGLADAPVRWLVDDAAKFVAREGRRGRRYDGILLDPPKFGRGPDGEVWRLEEHLPALIAGCRRLLDADSRFLFLTVYAVRMSALAIGEMLRQVCADLPGTVEAGELGVREEARGLILPTAIWARWSA